MSDKQLMTFINKGQIFTLFDKGKTLASIACETGYGVFRIKWLIEAIKNTQAWIDAKKEWKEYNENEKESRKDRSQSDKVIKKTLNSRSRNLHKRKNNENTSVRRDTKNISKRSFRSNNNRTNASRSDGSKSNSSTGSIVRSLKKIKDYKEK